MSVHISKWASKDRAASAGIKPLSVQVFIDKPDADTLDRICDWLSTVQPLHLYFYTFNTSRAINSCLTDAMLSKCIARTQLLSISFSIAVTFHTIRCLRQCKILTIGRSPDITPSSLATIRGLLYVKYGTYDPRPPCDPIVEWLKGRASRGMLNVLFV